MQTLWIDTDTASDDAAALMLALRSPEVDIAGISVVAGNVPVAQGVRNALTTVELCGKRAPVFAGIERPLLREPLWAYYFHGPDGMGGMNYPQPALQPEKKHAVEALIETVRARPGEITVVTIGPLTNLAVAVRMAPDIAGKIRRCFIMGGAYSLGGNVTPAAEYNFWFDPEAAQIVLQSGFDICLIGLDLCRNDACFLTDELDAIRQLNTTYSQFLLDSSRTALASAAAFGDIGLALPDPITVALAIEPHMCKRSSRQYVEVETQGEITRGALVVDAYGRRGKEANVEICWEINIARWKEILIQALG